MINIKPRKNKPYLIRLDSDYDERLAEIAADAGVKPTTAATQLLEAAIDQQYKSIKSKKAKDNL
jgi:predicted transcriptional regulator